MISWVGFFTAMALILVGVGGGLLLYFFIISTEDDKRWVKVMGWAGIGVMIIAVILALSMGITHDLNKGR